MKDKETIKSALESMMFLWGDPLDVKAAAELFEMDWKEVYELFLELQQEYESQKRGLRIREINHRFQFCTPGENDGYLQRFCTPVKEKKLSQSALEVLAIIAYKQPVTKAEVDSIRGVKSDRAVEGLMKRSLIRETGRSSGIGRPILYGTTDEFLTHFGFSSLSQLPEIEDVGVFVMRDGQGQEQDGEIISQIQLDFQPTQKGGQD